MQTTLDLIPANGIHIIPTYSPVGFNVAIYDEQGFTSQGRWFSTLDKAQAYAAKLEAVQ
jgi:hypothetical protein